MAITVCTALIDGAHSASYARSSMPKVINLAGAATNGPILEWEWSLVPTDSNNKGGYPSGSVIATGTVGDFSSGKASVQNPVTTLDVVGGYCFSLRARNADGWSRATYPLGDGIACQAIAYVLTDAGIYLPPESEFRYAQDLDASLSKMAATSLRPLDAPPLVASSYDDEFDAVTINTNKWTWIGAGAPTGSTGIFQESYGQSASWIWANCVSDSGNYATSHRLCQSCPSESFTMAAKVTGDVRTNYNHVGIFMDNGGDTYVVMHVYDYINGHAVHEDWCSNNSWTYDENSTTVFTNTVWLNMIWRKGKGVRFQFSVTGVSWMTRYDYAMTWTPTRIGLIWSPWTGTAAEYTGGFDWFRVTQPYLPTATDLLVAGDSVSAVKT